MLIKVNAEDDYIHYVSVVGYDNEYIYVSDSLEKLVNSENEYYNRKIAVDEFKKLWKNDVFFFDNIYITVSDNN